MPKWRDSFWAVQSLLAMSLIYHIFTMDAIPFKSNSSLMELKQVLFARVHRSAMSDLMLKTFDISKMCPPGINLRLGTKRLNLRQIRFTSADALQLAPSLYGQSFEERAEIWCKVAELNKELAASIGRNMDTFDINNLHLYQGDILLIKSTVDMTVGYDDYILKKPRSLMPSEHNPSLTYRRRGNNQRRVKRKVVASEEFKWQNGIVPWRFDDNGKFSSATKRSITGAIASWEQKTCLRFPQDNNPGSRSHIRFIDDGGCYSYIGKSANGQPISVGSGCGVLLEPEDPCSTEKSLTPKSAARFCKIGIVAHEIGHAIGFEHEQARPDRNRYVDINFSNVAPGFECNFYASTWTNFRTERVPYDYQSLMHYSSKDFGRYSGIETVIPTDTRYRNGIGQRNDLSFWDVKLANIWYCDNICGDNSLDWSRCEHGGYRNPNNCGECICPSGFAPPFCQQPQINPSSCGGITSLMAGDIVQVFSSPGFTGDGHPANTECFFTFRAPVNKRLRMRFVGTFQIEPENNQACRAYVEVRHENMALGGPRYCGFQTPSDIFTSHGSTALVRLFTLSRRLQGFQIEYSAETCGGCSFQSSNSEPACLRTVLYSCDVAVGSTVRENDCFDVRNDNKRYCCNGFELSGGNCIRSSLSRSSPVPPSPPPPSGQTVWGLWSVWSRCSRTCGLCGDQTRTRNCLNTPCIGDSSQQRRCESAVCPKTRRPRLCFIPQISICYTAVDEPCCDGAMQTGNQCTLTSG